MLVRPRLPAWHAPCGVFQGSYKTQGASRRFVWASITQRLCTASNRINILRRKIGSRLPPVVPLAEADAMPKTLAICIVALLAGSGTVLAQSTTPRSPAPVAAHPSPARPSTPSSLPSNQFSEESVAKSRCLGDTVVWVNLGG